MIAFHLGVLFLLAMALGPRGTRPDRAVLLPRLSLWPILQTPSSEPLPRRRPAAAPPGTGRAPPIAGTRSSTHSTDALSQPEPIEPLPSAPSGATVAPTEPSLRLGLPARAHDDAASSTRHPAREDPRANTSPASTSDRFARTLGTDTAVHEERLADGSLKIRRGNDCVRLTPSRNAEIDPMDDRSKRMPAAASGC